MATDALATLAQVISDIRPDFDKAIAGNKAAKTRVRKAMFDARNQAQEIRKGFAGSAAAAE